MKHNRNKTIRTADSKQRDYWVSLHVFPEKPGFVLLMIRTSYRLIIAPSLKLYSSKMLNVKKRMYNV